MSETVKAILIPTDDVEVAAHLERVAEGAGARVVTLTRYDGWLSGEFDGQFDSDHGAFWIARRDGEDQ